MKPIYSLNFERIYVAISNAAADTIIAIYAPWFVISPVLGFLLFILLRGIFSHTAVSIVSFSTSPVVNLSPDLYILPSLSFQPISR